MLAWLKKIFSAQEGTKEDVVKEAEPETAAAQNETAANTAAGETKFPQVVVGEILEVNSHPNADRLKITKVRVGAEVLDIVCGGPNVAAGQKVPVALVGAKLPNGAEIKEAELRGVKSFGMICAEDELGLSDQHTEIMVLDSEAVVGGPIDDYIAATVDSAQEQA